MIAPSSSSSVISGNHLGTRLIYWGQENAGKRARGEENMQTKKPGGWWVKKEGSGQTSVMQKSMMTWLWPVSTQEMARAVMTPGNRAHP